MKRSARKKKMKRECQGSNACQYIFIFTVIKKLFQHDSLNKDTRTNACFNKYV